MSTPVTNFGKVQVSGGNTDVATSIALITGHGSRLPSVGSFPLIWWNETDFADPADDPDREIVRATRVGDTLTVTRGAEGTTASNKNTANKTYKMSLSITAAMWAELQNLSLSQDFRGLRLQTHPDSDLAAKTVRLIHADAIVMDDGQEVPDWNDVDADITVSGLGGLDTGGEQASTWYEIHALYDGTLKKLQLHRAKDYKLDTSYTTGEDASQGLRSAVDNSTVRDAQGFKLATAGPCEFVDVKLIRTGSPVGNIWFTIEGNNGGVPNGTPLATSDKYDAARIQTTALFLRVPFRTPATLSVATQYHLVMYGDYTVSASNFISWRMDGSAASYANGSKALFDSDTSTWTLDTDDDLLFKVYITENDVAFVPPAGYSHGLIGYVYNDGSSNFKSFYQVNRLVQGGQSSSYLMASVGAASVLVDLSAFIPPVSVVMVAGGSGSVASGCAIGQLSTTDINGASSAEKVGQVGCAVIANGTGNFPGVALGPYQGAMFDNSAGATSFYLMNYLW